MVSNLPVRQRRVSWRSFETYFALLRNEHVRDLDPSHREKSEETLGRPLADDELIAAGV